MLAVSDNGVGMTKDVLEHLFEPFFTTKAVGKGTGLGLATVYGIVKQNGGFINVYSEPGQGSTFRIYFPRFESESVEAPRAVEAPAAQQSSAIVLIVEDETAILQLGKTILERLGYSVLAASTPSEAIGLVKSHPGPINLLITDVVMPEMNGRDLATEVKALRPGLKCLYMSGYTANVIAHHGVLDEGVLFIQKPFSMRELSEKVQEVLRS
jgi:CheY-like chemotaxis protein